MKVLVVGYGSIGRRHILNLSNIDTIEEIIVYTKIKGGFENTCEKKISFIDASIMDLGTVIDRNKVDFAIIANETYKHIDAAIILAKRKIPLFIEKPLSLNLEKVDFLKEIVQKNQTKVFVAYNLRFLPAIQYLKDQITQKVLGNLYFVQIEVGQYLPYWRSNVNYTNSYSANAEFGGGVALDLSHEVDYMRFLFGEPFLWKTLKSKASELDINSEDIFEGIYQYEHGFVCHVHMDYLQSKAKRKIRIVGSKGEILCDFIEKLIDIHIPDREIRLTEENMFKMEDTYKVELQHFIETLKSNMTTAISIDDGIKVLELLEDSHDKQA
ncbi:MAG: Gfo/Idh/MocA family oxidoreductase [Pseudomonadota bacterium]